MKQIAIVDDEREIVSILEKFLHKTGKYQVHTYTNPVTALQSLTQRNVDLVLLDIMMPQMDGIEFLEKLKKAKPETEVIMMTAYSTLERVLKSHKFGAEQYLTKPFDSLANVEKQIDAVLNRR